MTLVLVVLVWILVAGLFLLFFAGASAKRDMEGTNDRDRAIAFRVAPSPTSDLAVPQARGPGGRTDRDGTSRGVVSGAQCRIEGCERAIRTGWHYCNAHAEVLISTSHTR